MFIKTRITSKKFGNKITRYYPEYKSYLSWKSVDSDKGSDTLRQAELRLDKFLMRK